MQALDLFIPVNPILARPVYLEGYIEQLGTGLQTLSSDAKILVCGVQNFAKTRIFFLFFGARMLKKMMQQVMKQTMKRVMKKHLFDASSWLLVSKR